MKIKVINGPNLNMLGIREPNIYGKEDYNFLVNKIKNYCRENNIEVDCFQSNSEGKIIDEIQSCYFEKYDAIVINPGGYTHYSVAICDAIKSVMLPAVEVHISDINEREDFRKISITSFACEKSVIGLGLDGYIEAIKYLQKTLKN